MKWNRREVFRTAGSLGITLLLAGYLRYSMQGELLLLSKILLLAGGALILLAVVVHVRGILDFFSKRSSKLGTNTTVLALAVLVILGVVNYIGYRHHSRLDWTSEKLYTLSDQTKKIVGGLDKGVRVIRFAKTPDPNLSDLMAEYENLNRRIRYEVVDPQERPGMAKQYGVTRMGDVVVVSGTKSEHLEDKTEQDITSAILKVTRDTEKTVCFVEGHGEKSIDDAGARGYSGVKGELEKENYKTEEVNLVSQNGVPSACSVLVEAGPTEALFPQEAQMIQKYLDGGGKALILVDPETDPKLGIILQEWNVDVGNNVVIDVSGVGRIFGTGPAVPLVVDYGTSPITRNFERTMTFFPLARTVSVADRSKLQPGSVELLKTSPRSFTVPNLGNGRVRFDPAKDKTGPFSLGVAATRKLGNHQARLVVIGDSDFAANQWVNLQRNGDLFFNTINWLAEEEELISIRPKSPTNRRVTLTESQQKGLFWFSLVLLPGVVVLSGVYIWWKRR